MFGTCVEVFNILIGKKEITPKKEIKQGESLIIAMKLKNSYLQILVDITSY